ncbi:MAG: GerMN domain-containing protein [Eubacteriales bacterium]
MKKILFIVSLLFLVIFVSGCTTQKELTINDYYPFKENVRYVYEGIGNEYAGNDVFVDYVEDNRIQLRSNNGGTEETKVLENKDGQLTMLLSRAECYYRENLIQSAQSPGSEVEILLKEPLKQGTTWTLADNRKRTITNIGVEITTPLGKYETLEVTTEGEGYKTLDYYAINVGLVKSVYVADELEVSTSLSKIETNVPLTQTVKFYYPNVNEDKLYFVNKQLSFNTNDITRDFIEKEYKELPIGDVGKVLGPNVTIKSLYLNQDNVVYVDFTDELVSEMNAGSGYESMILQSITNTLGTYYGVDKVYITIEGSPYSSGHIIMEKGEPFIVNLENCVELK